MQTYMNNPRSWALLVPGLCLFGALTAHATAQDGNVFESLDKRFQQFSRDYYQQADKGAALGVEKYKNLTELKQQVEALETDGDSVRAIALLEHNQEILQENIDALDIIPITALLLKHNHWHGAKRLLDIANEEAGKSAIANISFEFAKYFIQRREWQAAYQYVDGVISDLSQENANYAHLMLGAIMQQQKKHREAIDFYQKVKPNSKYYSAAILNIAVAYIRQDWWTDAHVLINDAIKNHRPQLSDTMTDRLNLVLGYALLRKEFFRNSRDAFRNIRLSSPYANKALLGIALTAINQDDFIGALNAIKLLKDKKTTDLSVDESYLLLPYTYDKIDQKLTASSAYNDAIKYYQERINNLDETIKLGNSLLPMIRIAHQDSTLRIKSNEFDYSRQYPDSFFENYTQLLQLGKQLMGQDRLQREYNALLADNNRVLLEISVKLLNQRIEYLQSYMNQSRYGLARLYDNRYASNN